jgi:hypothetical protein
MQYQFTEYVNVETAKGNKRIKAVVSQYRQSRVDFMNFWHSEMEIFHPHYKHVEWHKQQLTSLFANVKKTTVLSRFDCYFTHFESILDGILLKIMSMKEGK